MNCTKEQAAMGVLPTAFGNLRYWTESIDEQNHTLRRHHTKDYLFGRDLRRFCTDVESSFAKIEKALSFQHMLIKARRVDG